MPNNEDLEVTIATELKHTLKLVPESQRELFVFELAKWHGARLAETHYEVHVLKGKLDDKQTEIMGVTTTFTLNANAMKTPEDFCKAITMWAFHRGNWQNFINLEELTPWIQVLDRIAQLQASAPTKKGEDHHGGGRNNEVWLTEEQAEPFRDIEKLL